MGLVTPQSPYNLHTFYFDGTAAQAEPREPHAGSIPALTPATRMRDVGGQLFQTKIKG